MCPVAGAEDAGGDTHQDGSGAGSDSAEASSSSTHRPLIP